MKKNEFLNKLAVVLDYDGEINENDDVSKIDVWDSLGILSILELLSELGLKIDPEAIAAVENISELLELVKPAIES